MRCLSCTKWIPQICERCRKPEVYDSEIERLRTRIADLEEAGRLLGALCWAWREDDKGSDVDSYHRLGAAIDEVNSHPTAAGFVKEAT